MTVTQKISLDFAQRGITPRITAAQSVLTEAQAAQITGEAIA